MTRRPYSQQVNAYRDALRQSGRRYIQLGTKGDGHDVLFDPGLLKTHLMVQAPTQHGKTYLVRNILRHLYKEPAFLFIDDPKGTLYNGAQRDLAALNMADRTVVLDTSRDELPSFNPLKKNGISPSDHAGWMMETIKAIYRQRSYDETQQLARWLYNSLEATVEHDGTFSDVLELLTYDSVARMRLVEGIQDEHVRGEWEKYDQWSDYQRREETKSAYARLKNFCVNPTVKRIVERSNSLDLAEMMREGQILLSHLPRYRPLNPSVVDMLRSILIQSVLASAFYTVKNRPPVYIVLDEAEHALERDIGAIETILDEGADLGIHLILIFHTFAQVQKSNPALLASVITNCKTKIIGGDMYNEDLKVLADHYYAGQWHPHIVRNELTALELEPVETTRTQRSTSSGGSESYSESRGLSASTSKGHSETATFGQSQGESESESFGYTYQTGQSKGKLPSGETENRSESFGDSYGGSSTRSKSTSKSLGTTWGSGTSTGTHSSQSDHSGSSWSETETEVPWHEYIKRQRVASRQFLNPNEFLAHKIAGLKNLKSAEWAIKCNGRVAVFKATRVREPRVDVEQFQSLVFSKPCYYDAAQPTKVPTPLEPEEVELEPVPEPLPTIKYGTDPAMLLAAFRYLTVAHVQALTGKSQRMASRIMEKVLCDVLKLDGKNVYGEKGREHKTLAHEVGISDVHVNLYLSGNLATWRQSGLRQYEHPDAFFQTTDGKSFFLEYQRSHPTTQPIDVARQYDRMATVTKQHLDLCQNFHLFYVFHPDAEVDLDALLAKLAELKNPCRFWVANPSLKARCGKDHDHTIDVPSRTAVPS